MPVDFSVTNQLSSPAIYASSFATRPAASFAGRLFVDTDNPSTGIYRDTGTAWIAIAGTGVAETQSLNSVCVIGNSTTTLGINIFGQSAFGQTGGIQIATFGTYALTIGDFSESNQSLYVLNHSFFNTTAQINTSLTTPLLIGGTTTTSTLTYRTTSAAGITGARHIFQVGNNGATEAMTILNNSNVGIGTASPTHLLQIFAASFPELRLGDATTTIQMYSGGAEAVLGTVGSHPFVFRTNATERMRIFSSNGNIAVNSSTDAGFKFDCNGTARLGALTGTSATFSGNVGIGLAPIIASGGAFSQIFIGASGQGGVLYGQNNAGSVALVANAYFNASNVLIYINTGNRVGQIYNYDGEFIFSNAPSGTSGGTVTLTPRLTIASTGAATFSSSVKIGNFTTAQKNALTASSGMVVYDTTLNKLCVYTTAWETITSI